MGTLKSLRSILVDPEGKASSTMKVIVLIISLGIFSGILLLNGRSPVGFGLFVLPIVLPYVFLLGVGIIFVRGIRDATQQRIRQAVKEELDRREKAAPAK